MAYKLAMVLRIRLGWLMIKGSIHPRFPASSQSPKIATRIKMCDGIYRRFFVPRPPQIEQALF